MGSNKRNHTIMTAAAACAAALLSAAPAFGQATDPFAPVEEGVIKGVGFVVFIVRVLFVGAAAWFGASMYFKRFDFVKLAGMIAGIVIVIFAGPIVTWASGLGGGGIQNEQQLRQIGGQTYTSP